MRCNHLVFCMTAVLALAMSARAHADAPGKVTTTAAQHIAGEFVEGGITCPLFRVDDGRVFALMGIDMASAQIGAKALLWGHEVRFSTCQQGESFAVERFELDSH